MSRDTLNLDSELLHEIKIWALLIGRQPQPTCCFEWPVYTLNTPCLAELAHGKGYCLITIAPRKLLGCSDHRRRLAFLACSSEVIYTRIVPYKPRA